MKLVKYCFLVLSLWLVTGAAWAQCNSVGTPPSDCGGVPFQAYIYDASAPNGHGQEVQAFCVGQTITFSPCLSRNITQLRYGVLPGTNATFPGCNVPINPTPPAPFIYTPTRADVGIVTVSELANANASGPIAGGGIYLVRTFRVYDNPAPSFTVAPCPSGFASVTVTDTNPYDNYFYTVQTGGGSTTPQPIVRGVPLAVPLIAGATSITVTGAYNILGVCTGTSQPQTITPLLPAQVPLFTRLTLQAPAPSTATLDIGQLPTGYIYSLQAADATAANGFRFVSLVPAGSTTFALPSAAGCYRLRRTDYCHRDSAFSQVICTASLTGASARNRNQLLLNDAGSPGTTYTVTRDGAVITGLTVIPGGLEDANVQCGTSYTYRITATNATGGMSVSNPVTILTQSSIPPVQPRLVASFNLNDVVEVTPLLATPALPTGTSLRYRRSAGGRPATDFSTATTIRPQRDSTALADLLAQPPCYTVQATDVCGNTSLESSAGCPSLLTATPADPKGTTATLTWTPFTGPNPSLPATYTLLRLTANGTTIAPPIPLTGNSFTDLTPPNDQQVLRYRLQISGAGLPAGTFSYSNRASVTRQLAITIPTAFTPNGDGLNDVLEVKGKYLDNYTFVVVDRNGQEVFRGTNRSQTWDGTIKGHAPVLGAYVWRFQQEGEDGKTFTATGAVTILK